MAFARVLARPRALILMGLALLNMLAVAHFFIRLENGVPTFDVYRLDLDVYRIGARAWLDGDDLYGPLPPTSLGLSLPFTYPPVSAVVFTPLTLVSLPVGSALLGLLTLLALIATLGIVLRSLTPEWTGRRRWLLVAAVLPVAALLEPVRKTVFYGQVNVVLMALVVFDCLARGRRWPRGVLVGLAAAVKLTPAAFVLLFLIRRDYPATLRAGLAFLAGTATGLLLAWDDSVRFWSDTLWDTGRIGNPHFAGNQSVSGVLARLGLESPAVWLVGSAVIVTAAAIGMRRALTAGIPALAVGLNALAVLAVSPVSWSHHWVWVIPVLLSCGIIWWNTRAPLSLGIAVAGLMLFAVAPQWWWYPETENVEYEWDIGQQVLGNAYVWFALSVLAAAAACRDRPLCCPIGHLHRSAGRIRSVGSLPASRPPRERNGFDVGLPSGVRWCTRCAGFALCVPHWAGGDRECGHWACRRAVRALPAR